MRLLKELFVLLFISLAIALFIRGIDFFSSSASFDVFLNIKSFLITYLYAFIIGAVNILGFSILNRLLTWEKSPQKMLWIGILGSVLWTIGAYIFVRYTHLVYFEGLDSVEFWKKQSFISYLIVFLIASIVTLAFHAFYFFKALQESKIKEQTFKAQTNAAHLQALQSQVDPHFLFNSLNVLSALIEENPKKAQDFTDALSSTYRYILEVKDAETIALIEELQFVKTYMELMTMRFEDSIELKLEVENCNQQKHIVPLSLQLLLENAIKHNKISPSQTLKIQVYCEGNYIVVNNNLQPKKLFNTTSTGIGINNIKTRYANFTNNTVLIVKDEHNFTVKLPLISQ